MGTKSREVIWGGQILDAKMRAKGVIKLTEKREITPYKWVHPDNER